MNEKRILIVDDEENLFNVITMALEEEFPNLKYDRALNGVEALEICQKRNLPYDLMITDLNMP